MFVFPDAAKCVKAELEAVGFDATLQLNPEDLDGREIVHIKDIGGTEQSVFRTDRLTVDVYAQGRTAAKDLAEAVRAALLDRPLDTPHGVVDSVKVDVVPTKEEFPSATLVKFTAIYRAETRPI